MKLLALAIAITAEAFKNKLDRGGQPYILHCLNVMDNTDGDEDEKCAAVMHDLVEDTRSDQMPDIPWTYERLRSAGFSERTIDLIKMVTFPENCDDIQYMEQIKRIALNPGAKKIKKADLRHNSDITRLKGLRKKDIDRLEKYSRAYIYLSE